MSRARDFADLAAAYSDGALSNRNMIINGAMNICQRGAAHSGAFTTSQSGYFLDMWSLQNNTAGRATITQDTNVPSGQGFLNSLKVDVTTADTSLAAGDIIWLAYRWEGQFLQQIRKGTSDAKKVTLQFWVSSPKTGVHTLHFYDGDNGRSVATTYTITTADTWQKVIVTFPADTTGAFDDDAAQSLQLYIGLMAGSTYTSGTLDTSWASNTNANRMVGQVNVFDSTSNNFYITGVQMELGEVATPFEFEPIGETLIKCQRYYYKTEGSFAVPGINELPGNKTMYGYFVYPQRMRAAPTASFTGMTLFQPQVDASSYVLDAVGYNTVRGNGLVSWTGSSTVGSTGDANKGYFADDSGEFMEFTAEL